MGVIKLEADFDGIAEKSHQLSTKFVRDWRIKQFEEAKDGGEPIFKWLRRSRLVAREYAFLEKRQDVYSPASSTHVLNLLPLLWLQQCSDLNGVAGGVSNDEPIMAALDIKDAFLEVPQHTPLSIKLANQTWVVLKNLPGQRLGARAWYWYLRAFLEEALQFEFCSVQPCLARTQQCAILIHVDDILFVGNRQFWDDFKAKLQQRFSISFSILEGTGSEISFLKRRILRVDDGLALLPGNNIAKLIKVWEEKFGKLRTSTTPADPGIQMEDNSQMLLGDDATFFRMAVGTCLYVTRDRPDIAFTVKELSSYMSSPTVAAMRHLRKLVSYLKETINYAVVLKCPYGGQGLHKQSNDRYWLLESFSDSDWSSDKRHRRSTSSGLHMLCGNLVYSSSRT